MARWSPEQIAHIEEVLAERLEGMLAPGEALGVEGESSAEQVQARFTVAGGAKGERLVLESKVERGKRLSEEQARDLALDALDLMLLEYLESERAVRFPGVWERRELRGQSLWVRGERDFPDLDAQADALLSKDRS